MPIKALASLKSMTYNNIGNEIKEAAKPAMLCNKNPKNIAIIEIIIMFSSIKLSKIVEILNCFVLDLNRLIVLSFQEHRL